MPGTCWLAVSPHSQKKIMSQGNKAEKKATGHSAPFCDLCGPPACAHRYIHHTHKAETGQGSSKPQGSDDLGREASQRRWRYVGGWLV